MENSPELPSNIEVEEHHRTQVWIIDDNTDFNDALQRSLKYGEDRGVDFKFFNYKNRLPHNNKHPRTQQLSLFGFSKACKLP